VFWETSNFYILEKASPRATQESCPSWITLKKETFPLKAGEALNMRTINSGNMMGRTIVTPIKSI